MLKLETLNCLLLFLLYLYVQNEARKALLAMDGYVMDGHEMKVAISNPPARRPPVTSGPAIAAAGQQQNQGSVRSLGGTSKQVIERLVSYIYVYVRLCCCRYPVYTHYSVNHPPLMMKKENGNNIINS